MLGWLSDPFGSDVVARAFIAGVIVACLCAVVGTWVVLRGAAFLGDAMSHGVLPGVAVASLVGGNVVVGAMIAALAMAYGVSAITSSSRISADTSIGLLLVGMLAVGVIIVSHSQSYAIDLTGFLFGDVLAVRTGDIAMLAVALTLTTMAALIGRRAFVAATFDVRKAVTLGMRPKRAAAALTVLIAIAIVASFQVVGTLLVFGLLIAPPAAAVIWSNTIPQIMIAAAGIGAVSVLVGLIVSWHAGTAGGATIAAVAVGIFFLSLAASAMRAQLAKLAAVVTAAACVAGCGSGDDAALTSTPPPAEEHGAPPTGAEESAEPVTRLVIVDPATGQAGVFDVLDEKETDLGRFGPVEKLSGDGRFGYLHTPGGLTVVDAGSWTVDHGDHNHYYVAEPSVAGTVDGDAESIVANQNTAAVRNRDGSVELLDRDRLGQGEVAAPSTDIGQLRGVALAVPNQNGLLMVTEDGRLQAMGEDGLVRELSGECPAPTGVVTMRRSVIFGCENGAVHVGVSGAEPAVTPIPFPADRPAAALGALQHRDRHDQLAAIAGDDVWALDTGRQTWSPVLVTGAVAASTGDDGEVLVLTRDGLLRTVDAASGAETASLELFDGRIPSDGPAPVIEVDSDRAYINNAAAKKIYEIDYRDELRIARTLKTGVTPGLMVEAGR